MLDLVSFLTVSCPFNSIFWLYDFVYKSDTANDDWEVCVFFKQTNIYVCIYLYNHKILKSLLLIPLLTNGRVSCTNNFLFIEQR